MKKLGRNLILNRKISWIYCQIPEKILYTKKIPIDAVGEGCAVVQVCSLTTYKKQINVSEENTL